MASNPVLPVHGVRMASVAPSPRPVFSLLHLVLLITIIGVLQAHALPTESSFTTFEDVEPKPADDPSLWVYLGTAVVLVLLGGAFAGLTIA